MTPHARHSDPLTSHQAAASVKTRTVKRLQLLIIEVLEERGVPMTDEELFDWVQWKDWESVSPSSLRTRRSELVDKGVIRAAKDRGVTAAGRSCTRWELVPQQQLSLEE